MTRVWVTRMEEEGGELATELRQCGLLPIVEPVLQVRLEHKTLEEIARLQPDDWLVLTSPYAIRAVAHVVNPAQQVAVIGQSSADLARNAGLNVQFISPTADATGLWKHFENHPHAGHLCYPRSSLAPIPQVKGLRLQAPVLYSVTPRAFDEQVISRVEVVTFTSSSAVHAVLDRLANLLLPVASLGPSTSATLRNRGITPIVEAERRTLKSLALAVRNINGVHFEWENFHE